MLPAEIEPFQPERVRNLPPTQRKIVEYMLEAGPDSWTLSGQALGERVGTSSVNVVRAAQALGYPKLAHLRLALADYAVGIDPDGVAPVSRMEATLGKTPVNELLGQDIAVARDGLAMLEQQISTTQFTKAVDLLNRSNRIVWRGIGPSAHLAEYAAQHCERIGHHSIAITERGRGLADDLLSLQRKDAVVILHYGGSHQDVQVIVAEATSLDVKVLMITDHPKAAPTKGTSLVLTCPRGRRNQFQSHAVTMILIESLILGVADRNATRRRKSLAKLERLRMSITEEG